MNDCGIYEIVNTVNYKKYIGSSKNLYKRKWEHQKRLKTNRHSNQHLQSAYNKYGKGSFEFKTILICRKEDLLFYEDSIIKAYQSNDSRFGYNMREAVHTNRGMSLKFKSGDIFNRLTLLYRLPQSENLSVKWMAQCSCGILKAVCPYTVKRGMTKSCGCFGDEVRSAVMKARHADPVWSQANKERSRRTMIKTMSDPKNHKKAKNG